MTDKPKTLVELKEENMCKRHDIDFKHDNWCNYCHAIEDVRSMLMERVINCKHKFTYCPVCWELRDICNENEKKEK